MLNKLLYSSFFLAVLFPWMCSTKTTPYKHIGCFKDSRTRAVPNWLGYIQNHYDVNQCADKASADGYPLFGLQVGNECRGGFGDTYHRYGRATNCKNGGGGRWANDVYEFTGQWPKGTFSFLKPLSGCPSDFIDNGWLLQDTVVKNKRSAVLNIGGFVSREYVFRSFCTKITRTSPVWPKGQYCIYREGDRTPANTNWGRIKMIYSNNKRDTKKMKNNKGIIPYSGYTFFSFYCQTTGDKSVPIDLPISQPFYLLPYGSSECQQVKWMVATKEWIRYGTRNHKSQNWQSGETPYIELGESTSPGLKMFYCHYTSCNHTLNNTQGAFSSPRYPEKYPDGQLCSWRILVPVNHTVLVHFILFSLDDDNRNDGDVLEFHRLVNKSFVLNEKYRGYREPFNVSSTSDLLYVFRSNEANSSQGFRAEYEVFIPETVVTTVKPFTTIAPLPPTTTTIQEPTSHSPTEFDSSNKTKHEAFKEDSEGTGTILLIVIPLVCFILIVVVAVDIYYRCRSNPRKKSKDSSRNEPETADNVTYGSSPEVMRMAHFNSTTTITTTVDNEQQDTDKGYERLSHIAPRREVPEEYEELNRSSHPRTTDRMPIPDNDPSSFYHVLEKGPEVYEEPNRSPNPSTTNFKPTKDKEPDSFYHVLEGPKESVDDEAMYQAIDKDSCDEALYERNVLYDNVA